ncbi:uncharacterized protein LOC135098460 [Scylla paramamosain]|uniref:uncharacterized protein LOC135098460 n=1 Tax=Scylla paramamosain TaxID=85552 RepID=UPI003082B281
MSHSGGSNHLSEQTQGACHSRCGCQCLSWRLYPLTHSRGSPGGTKRQLSWWSSSRVATSSPASVTCRDEMNIKRKQKHELNINRILKRKHGDTSGRRELKESRR